MTRRWHEGWVHRVLTESSSTFLRRRRVGRHFERRPLLDALLAKASPVSASGDAVPRAPAPSAVELRALAAAQGNPAAALALLKSQPDALDAAEAAGSSPARFRGGRPGALVGRRHAPCRLPTADCRLPTADCRVLSARDLFIAQSAMTGESLPVEKFVQGDVFGAATALVLATGGRSYFGTLAAHATAAETTPNAFQAGVNSVSWLLIRFAAVMVAIVFLVNGFTKGNWLEALLFAMSVAVGLTPEMLSMIVTTTFAKGAMVLSRKKVVVKRLDTIQNFRAPTLTGRTPSRY